MDNKTLIQQLKKLKSIKPDENWKNSNRAILFNQIKGSVSSANEDLSFIGKVWQNKISVFLHQPALAVVLVCFLVIGGSALSLEASRWPNPGSSLYIARVVSEKAQLAITFNEQKKARLDFKFTNNHIKDITGDLAKMDEDNQSKSEKLTENFKKEIASAKTKLQAIKATPKTEETEDGESIEVFSANSGKEDRGLQVATPNSSIEPEELPKEVVVSTPENIIENQEATSTKAVELDDEISNAKIDEAHQILNEAEELLDEKNYDGILDKLQEAENIVENIDDAEEIKEDEGEVKGISEEASSTKEVF